MTTPRPSLLTFGIVVNALHAGLMVLLSSLALVGMMGAFGISLAALPIPAVWPFTFLMGFGAFFALLYLAFYSFALIVCWGSWNGSRAWTWALIVLSVLGLANTGPISVVIGVLTIVGALQYLGVLSDRAERTA